MIIEMQMMCKDLTGWSVDSVGEKVNEIIRALNAMESANTATNSAMDAICALDTADCEHSVSNVGDKLACVYTGECPHKQHQ
jgi:hypothetical protein